MSETKIAESIIETTSKDFKGKVDPDWCPGCGDFSVLKSLQVVVSSLGPVSYTHLLAHET